MQTLEESCRTRMYTSAESLVRFEQVMLAVMLDVLTMQHPGDPAGDVAGEPPPQSLTVVVPDAQTKNMHTSRSGASICTVGSTAQPVVSLPE